ncbi:MAG: serine/threonine-protein kinase [Solirubrobacteraceae bacterium]
MHAGRLTRRSAGTRVAVTVRPPQAPALPARYEIRRHIASGGTASVWCAQDTLLRRSVAIKILGRELARDDNAVRRFNREARAAARLSGHPHVVRIYDVGETGGRPYIVMEHLAGGTVADAIRVGAVQRDDAIRWLREAAAALDYAHAHGVVHRDIKPGNLLLAGDRSLYVADFGIAQVASEDTLTSAGQLLGTAAYLSPEQALGLPATDASDRYALAVAAYELLVGARPFAAEHFAAQARQHIECDPPRASRANRALPRALDAVLIRGMAKRPADRWPTAQAFVAALEAALGKRAAAARLPTRAAALAALTAACAALAVVLATGGARPSAARRTPVIAAAPRAATHPVATAAAASRPRPKPPPRPAPATAAALEARGHQLMLDGDFTQAVGVLQQAVAAAAPGDLEYAYALYDLGRSLLLAGDPAAAIPVLERRLQIPNQTPVVLTELRLAQQAAGEGTPPSDESAPPSRPVAPVKARGRVVRKVHGPFASAAGADQGA